MSAHAQSPRGKRDGLHKEYYPDRTLKAEYLVKNEKIDGFLRIYDREGNLEYRDYYIDGVFDGTDRSYYHYELFFWYWHLRDEGEEVLWDAGRARDYFADGYDLANEPIGGNWMGIVRTRMPTGKDAGKRHPVTLTAITSSYIYLKEYVQRDDLKTKQHYFFDVLRRYKVRRAPGIDDLFNVPSILAVLQQRHTAIEYGTPFGQRNTREGSRLMSVEQFLGSPDYVRPLKAAGWFDIYYDKENVRFLGHNSAVYFVEYGRPDWVVPDNRNKTLRELLLEE